MAHKINSIMYVGEKPWHGLGTKLDGVATSAEAIRAAGLDWAVKKEAIQVVGGRVIPEKFAVVRCDTLQPLGVVGKQFTPLQNRDAFRFFDAIVGVKEAMYHTAGSLGDGERIWILAKLPGYIQTVGDDVTEKFLLLAHAHDGSMAVKMMFTPIRVVCNNTLNIALRDWGSASRKVSLRHTVNIGYSLKEARESLGIMSAQFSLFEEASRRLAQVQVDQEKYLAYLGALGLMPAEKEDQDKARAKERVDSLLSLFEGGKGTEIKGVRGTAWGAFNAVAEYADYCMSAKNIVQSVLFGSSAILKQAAWDEAVKLSR